MSIEPILAMAECAALDGVRRLELSNLQLVIDDAASRADAHWRSKVALRDPVAPSNWHSTSLRSSVSDQRC